MCTSVHARVRELLFSTLCAFYVVVVVGGVTVEGG